MPVTLMLTTAPPLRVAICEKSGSAIVGAGTVVAIVGTLILLACACDKLKAPKPAAPRMPVDTSPTMIWRERNGWVVMMDPFKMLM
jgi:hypothetical protein